YVLKPQSIDKSYVDVITGHRTYLGQSIIGHLLHNFVFQVSRSEWSKLRQMVRSNEFWKSKWPFIQLQVNEIEAGHLFMSKKIKHPPNTAPKVLKECYHALITVENALSVVRKTTKNERLQKVLS